MFFSKQPETVSMADIKDIENILKIVKDKRDKFEDIWGFLSIYKDFWLCWISDCVWLLDFENIWSCLRLSEEVWGCVRTSEDIWECLRTSKLWQRWQIYGVNKMFLDLFELLKNLKINTMKIYGASEVACLLVSNMSYQI